VKKNQKELKYKDQLAELQGMWNENTMTVTIIIDATVSLSRSFKTVVYDNTD
jgi:hypothetical protein